MADEYLRTLAIARLFFDNIPSLQSSWVTMGPKIGQLAMFFGANDMGSVMMEENVVSAAGTTYKLSEREICRLIRDAGWIPAQRDQYYNVSNATTARIPRTCVRSTSADAQREEDRQGIHRHRAGLDGTEAEQRIKVQLPLLGS